MTTANDETTRNTVMGRWASSILKKFKKRKRKKKKEKKKTSHVRSQTPPWTWFLLFFSCPLSLSLGGIFDPLKRKKLVSRLYFIISYAPALRSTLGLLSFFFFVTLDYMMLSPERNLSFFPNVQDRFEYQSSGTIARDDADTNA
ncbi:hypothetical protein GGI35DRAFT_267204 [Trichoderma velutinum]